MADSDKQRYWVGFDLGGTKMQATVFDEKFKNLGAKRKKTKAHEGAKAGLERVISTIKGALDEAGVSAGRVGGIGVGCPGPLDLNKGVVLELANLGWKDVPLKKAVEDAFGCPTHVINDVDAGTYGEYCFGAAKKAHCVLGVFPGTGIGGGCIYDGRILRGKVSSCMEIGHIQVMPDGPLCGCGRHGCLEAVASRLAIASAAAVAAHRGQAPHLFERASMDLLQIKSSVLAEAVAAGDKAVEQIIRDAANWLGVGISIAVHLLTPDVVVLGGGLVEAMPELIVKAVERAARNHVMPALKDTFTVVAARLGDDASVTGAAAWARENVAN